jgi:hypothetical protein
MLLGTVFLIGAVVCPGAGPARAGEPGWMSGLLVLSTLDAALGLRALVRLRLRKVRLALDGNDGRLGPGSSS